MTDIYRLKGFITIPAFTNQTPGSVSPLGELTDNARSFSRENGLYTKQSAPNVALESFLSTMATVGTPIVVPARVTDNVLEITQWIFTKSIAGDITDDPDSFSNLLLGEYGSVITNLECGKMVSAKGNWMPSYIAWKLDDGGDDNLLRVWFSNEAFEAQFGETEIIVVSPIEPIDTFQKVRSEVVTALSQFNLPDHDEKAHRITAGEPETIRVTKDYMWHDREDVDATLNTSWTVCIYGIAGNNPSLIKEAIADYILANSAYSKEEWIPVFPDIFTSTEFPIIPMYHLTSIPDATVKASLYSPIVPYNVMLPLAEKYIDSTTAGHVESYLTVQTLHYKSIAYLTAGSIDNRDSKYLLKDYFPDYALIPPGSPDINRMSKYTYDWIILLTRAFITAEELDEYMAVDQDFARVERDGRTYVAFDYDNVVYLVLARMSMDEINVPE